MPTFVTMTGPGTAKVTDDTALMIKSVLTPALVTQFTNLNATLGFTAPGTTPLPGTIKVCLQEINSNICRIADSEEKIAKTLSDLTNAVDLMSASVIANTNIQTVAAANQIATNNFQTQVTKEALTRAELPLPTLPSLTEQLKEAVKQGTELNVVSNISGAVTDAINSTVKSLTTLITGTAAYRGIKAYIDSSLETLKAKILPSKATQTSRAYTGRSPIDP